MIRSIGFIFGALAWTSWLSAQDSRTVTEPSIPEASVVCSVLMAQLASVNGDLDPSDNSQFDTWRMQNALNGCPYGGAVELQPTDSYDSFQIQPITIPAGVTLLVDPGATVFGSLDPRDYDVAAGSCGIIATSSPGCKPLITVRNANDVAIMGGGTIDGRGGDTMIGSDLSWWQLARLAQQMGQSQFNPRLIQVTNSGNFVLYQITLQNAPNFHVATSGVNGLTAWGITINTPYDARNTDGIDPGNSTNVTITQSSISDGDDNVALGAGGGPSSNMTIDSNYFGSGHGMSIGSYTRYGVSKVVVSNLNISGEPTDHNDTGLRIKSDSSRGGLVQYINYSNVCMMNVYNPVVFDPFYSSATGDQIPDYQNIEMHQVHVLTQGRVKLEGHDADHPLGLTLDNVIFDIPPLSITAESANITLGPAPVNLGPITGPGVSINDQTSTNDPPYDCSGAFPGAGAWRTAGAGGVFSSIQNAVDALPPTGGTIGVSPGTYNEVVHVDKPNVRIRGLGKTAADVVITSNNSAGEVDGRAATLFARGDGFFAENVSIQNTAGLGWERNGASRAAAVAVFVDADRAVFRNVRAIAQSNTIYARSKTCDGSTCIPARQYFFGSYIEGSTDIISGDAAAAFDHCTIYITGSDSAITASQRRLPGYLSGFVFVNSTLRADRGVTNLSLSRSSTEESASVWLHTFIAAPVHATGRARWALYDGNPPQVMRDTVEYRSFGPGARGRRDLEASPVGERAVQEWEPNAFLHGSDGWQPTLIH